jgi:hypothetical protein
MHEITYCIKYSKIIFSICNFVQNIFPLIFCAAAKLNFEFSIKKFKNDLFNLIQP